MELVQDKLTSGVDGMDTRVAPKETAVARVPPYIAYRTLKTFIEDLRVHGIPNRIDRSVWGARFSGSVGTQLMSALRFLHLIDADDHPTELRKLVGAAQPGEWKAILKSVLEGAYQPILGLNLKELTSQQLNDEFRKSYKAQDDVLRKSITFFLQAAQEAGIEISSRILKGTRRVAKPRSRPAPKKAGTELRVNPVPATRPTPPLPSSVTPYQTLVDLLDPEKMEEEEQQAVWTLIRYLKRAKR